MSAKTKAVVVGVNSGGRAEIDIPAVSGWDGFDKLREYLLRTHGAHLVSQVDGPDARKCILSIRGYEISLIHDDPYGNSIQACNRESDEILQAIGADLSRRLATVQR